MGFISAPRASISLSVEWGHKPQGELKAGIAPAAVPGESKFYLLAPASSSTAVAKSLISVSYYEKEEGLAHSSDA